MADTSGRKFASRTAAELTDLRILEGIPDAVIVHDVRGRLVYANEAAARGLGIEPGSGTGGNRADLSAGFEVYDESGARMPVESFPGRLALDGTSTTGTVLRIQRTGPGENRRVA